MQTMQLQNSPSEPMQLENLPSKEPFSNYNYRMFKKSSNLIKLPKPYRKILYLYPAFNNTYVFLGVAGLKQDCVTHVDAHGNILFQYIFPIPMDTAGMISDREFIMLETRSKWYLGPQGAEEHETGILVLNLQTHTFQRKPHSFFYQETDQSYIITFAQTKLLCIKQIGRYNDNRFKLTYYQYPLTPKSQPINAFRVNSGQWTFEYVVKQANDHSMMAWFKARHDQVWDFRTFDLRDNPDGNYKAYKIKQTLGVPYGLSNVQCALNTMWEIRKDEFMMVCISNKTDDHKNKELGVIQNNFVLNVATGNLREAKFSFGDLQELVIDQTYLGDICMFRTFDFKDGKPLETPIYYINNKTQEIVMKETWHCSYLHKDEPTSVKQNSLVHNQYENGDCDWFICQVIHFKKMFRWKDASLSLLLGIYEDFDEDLLADTLELIEFQDDDPIFQNVNE